MNLTGRPITPKPPKRKPAPGYLDKVRALPCCICEAYGLPQLSKTTAHHCCHGRFSSRKADDRDAIPLCDGHHQGLRDKSKLALHRDKAAWEAAFGPDHDWIEQTRARIG